MKIKQLLCALSITAMMPLPSAAWQWMDPETHVFYEEKNSKEAFVAYVDGEQVPSDVAILSTIIVDNVEYTVTSIGEEAFSFCSKLKSITIPGSVKSIGASAFWSCWELERVELSMGLEIIGPGAFSVCPCIETLYIPESVRKIESSAFYGCWNLSSINIPQNINEINEGTFGDCYKLTEIVIPESVTTIGMIAFEHCAGLTSLTIPASVTTIMNSAFYGCSGLTSINIPNSVTSIGEKAFSFCESLETIVVEQGNQRYDSRDNCNAIIETETNTLITGCKTTIIPHSVTSIGYCAFEYCTGMTSIDIPNSVTSIGDWAFYNCTALTSVYSHIEEPFEIDRFVFWYGWGYSDHFTTATLYVPAGTKNAYKSTEGWRNFQNIEEIVYGGYSLTLTITGDEGTDLTDKVGITWYDADGKQIGAGKSLNGIKDGMELYYSVVLGEELGRVYREVKMRKVVAKDNAVTCQLERIAELSLHGVVTSDGATLPGADVSLMQWLNGKYEYEASAKADEYGEFTLRAYADSTLLTISAKGYADKKMKRSRLYGADLGTIELEPVQGMVVSLQLSYQEAVREGEEPMVQGWNSDTRNIVYTVRNVTKDADIADFAMQMGDLVLPFGSEAGDRIQVTLRSLNDAFAEASGEGVISSEGIAEIAMTLMAYGGVEAIVSQRGDEQLLAMLYGSDGRMVRCSVSSSRRITFTGLKAGGYTLVAMGYNGAVGSIGDLSDLDTFGLEEGGDYVKTAVAVKDGIIGSVTIDEVPELDASKFEYTSLNTSYLPNKSQMTVNGSFVTLTARVDFKTQYANEVSDVRVVVDIPEGCEFITNSVVTGTKALPHTLNGNQLTITLSGEDFDNRIRFCMMPKQTGTFTSTAYADFDYHGEKRQAIGTAVFEATAGSIVVPSVTASPTIAVSGIAAPHATVDVYDDDHAIGTTTALGDGKWRTDVELYKPYNLSTHDIYAKYETADGIKATTESQECLYDMTYPKAKSVTMSFYNAYMRKNISVMFDFETGKTSSTSYSFYTATDFTFVADLTANDTTRVKGVTFYVHTTTKEVRTLKGFFDENLNRWVAVSYFDSNNLPVNVAADVEADVVVLGDRTQLDDGLTEEKKSFDDAKAEMAEIDESFNLENIDLSSSLYERGLELFADDNLREEDIKSFFDELSALPMYDGDIDTVQLSEECAKLMAEADDFLATHDKDTIFMSLNLNTGLLEADWPSAPFSGTYANSGGAYHVEIEQLTGINEDELIEAGYEIINLTDGSKVYSFSTDNNMIYIDSGTLEKLTFSFAEIPASRVSARINPALPFAAEFELAFSLLKSAPNMGTSSSAEIEAKIKVLESVLKYLTIGYSSALSWFSNKWTSTVTNFLSGLDGGISALEVLKLKMNKELLNKQLLHEVFPMEIFRSDVEAFLDEFNKLERLIAKLKKLQAEIVTVYEKVQQQIKRLPKAPKFLPDKIKVGGKLLGGFGAFIEICGLYSDIENYISDLKGWQRLLYIIEKTLPCPKSHEEALTLQRNSVATTKDMDATWSRIIAAESTATAIDIASLATEWAPPAALGAWLASGAFNVYAEWSKLLNMNGPTAKFIDKLMEYSMALGELKCKENDDDDDDDDNNGGSSIGGNGNGGNDNGGNGNHGNGNRGNGNGNDSNGGSCAAPPVTPIHDPSGYVYEAVPTNRVEGVTASIYFDQQNPTMWDAADFSQVNPQVTDETGLYQWDVPQGMWQVCFEKSGYETTQTDWLPVPPPQLEINIPMSEAVAPTVVKARGMESGITLDFSKYMKPATLEKSGRVSATVNGKNANGEVEMLNLEEDPYNKKEYASKVKFVPSTAFKTTDEVIITVKKEVESYADKQMENDFVATVKIEPEIKSFVCDSIIAVDYQGEGVLEIAVVPAAAAKGRTVSITPMSAMIATTDQQSVTLDDDGKATVTVNGNLPGGSSLHLQLDGLDIEKYVEVNVVLAEKVVKKPKASKRSGSTIEEGYLLWLTCSTPGATIYYTLDGSCPCDEQTRKKYIEPFVLPGGEVTVKAIAVRQGMDDSDVATFTYLVNSPVGISTVRVIPDVEVTYDNGQLNIVGAEGCTLRVYDMLGHELANIRSARRTQAFKVTRAEGYVVSITTNGLTVVKKVLGSE